jgi:hypothetical protein
MQKGSTQPHAKGFNPTPCKRVQSNHMQKGAILPPCKRAQSNPMQKGAILPPCKRVQSYPHAKGLNPTTMQKGKSRSSSQLLVNETNLKPKCGARLHMQGQGGGASQLDGQAERRSFVLCDRQEGGASQPDREAGRRSSTA